MKKKKVFLLIVVMLITVVSLTFTYIKENQYEIIYERMWDISISNSAKELYSIKSEIGFNGDGVRYSVYEIGNESITGVNLVSDSNKEIENEILLLLRELNIKDDMVPPFLDNYSWCNIEKNNDSLWIVKTNNFLYILQSTM